MNLEDKAYPHHIHIHRYGHHTEMTLHIKFPRGKSLEEAHDRATLIEDTIRQELDIEATLHMEPLSARIGDPEA